MGGNEDCVVSAATVDMQWVDFMCETSGVYALCQKGD